MPIWRVERGSDSPIQALSLSCCSRFRRQELPSWPKPASPSIPSSSYRRCQVRTVSSSMNKTFATAAQLMPLLRSSSAFARRPSRRSTDPSRASSIRSRLASASRNPARIISRSEFVQPSRAREFSDIHRVRVYIPHLQVPYPGFVLAFSASDVGIVDPRLRASINIGQAESPGCMAGVLSLNNPSIKHAKFLTKLARYSRNFV